MKAILTKYLGQTNTKPGRIKAYAEGGHSITISEDACNQDGRTQGQAHLYAAEQLAAKMGWFDYGGYLIGGGTPDGYCFVFSNSFILNAEQAERQRKQGGK